MPKHPLLLLLLTPEASVHSIGRNAEFEMASIVAFRPVQRRIIPDQVTTLLVAVRVVELSIAVGRDGRHGKLDSQTAFSGLGVVVDLAVPGNIADPICESSVSAFTLSSTSLTGMAVTRQNDGVVDLVLNQVLQCAVAVGDVATPFVG